MTSPVESLATAVTTDLVAITRRSVVESTLEKTAATGVGWVPANLSLTPFNSIGACVAYIRRAIGQQHDEHLRAVWSARPHRTATGAT